MTIPFEGPDNPLAVRTPDACFGALSDFDFASCYVDVPAPASIAAKVPTLRMHAIDEGPKDAPVVLMTHGEPTWSYLYRKMIPVFASAGFRAVAPDHIGFGRSDKMTRPADYSFENHIDRLEAFVLALDLREITLVCQDWGGPLGMGVLARQPERFARVVAGNTMLHTAETELAGRLTVANHGSGDENQTISNFLLDWMLNSHRAPDFSAGPSIEFATARPVAPEIVAAYDAPFPSEWHKAGMRQFPAIIPATRTDPGSAINLATWEALRQFSRPFLTLFGDADPSTAGWETIFRERVPGAADQPHQTLKEAGHFWQEDCGDVAAEIILSWIKETG